MTGAHAVPAQTEMDTLTQVIIGLTDNLKAASNELSISMLGRFFLSNVFCRKVNYFTRFPCIESDNLFRFNDKLTAMEEELAVVKMMIAQERQILSAIKVSSPRHQMKLSLYFFNCIFFVVGSFAWNL